MKPIPDASPPPSLSEQMARIEDELKSGRFKPRAHHTVPERSEEEKARIQAKLDTVWGSIPSARADEINAEIYRMRDEERD